jgi:hypothetical protein
MKTLVYLWITVSFYAATGSAMVTFDECLETLPACKHLQEKKPSRIPRALKALLKFVVSPKEQAKYDCVLKGDSNTQSNVITPLCQPPVHHFEFHRACNADILKFCKKIRPGEHRLNNCLAMHREKLSSICRSQLRIDNTPPDPGPIPDYCGNANCGSGPENNQSDC